VTPANRRVRAPDAGSVGATAARHPRRSSGVARVFSAARTVTGVALVVAASAGFAWLARRHVTTSARFAIARVDVAGTGRRSSEAIAAESGLAPGTNIFAADLDAARAKILADPWISDAVISRRLPGAISIQVTERKAAALVALGDLVLATADGEPFKRFEPGDPIDLPLVTGVAPEALAFDRTGAVRSVRGAIDVAAEFERGPLARRAPLQEVHVAPDGAYTLVVGRSAIQLALGHPPFRRKLDQASRVVAELDKRGGKPEAIMLDNDTRPERVVVRLR
jgi:cell division protein FtsQ